MHFRIVPFSMMLMIASPAFSQTLWKNVTVGMNSTEVQTLYPANGKMVRHRKDGSSIKGAVEVGVCRPEVFILYVSGKVDSVIVSMVPDGGLFASSEACVHEVYDSLTSKYGAPTSEQTLDKKDEDTGRESQKITSTWLKDGVSIRLERDVGFVEEWRINYRAVQATGL